MELIPITYHGKKYPFGIESDIEEIAGHLDKETINPKQKYSLHTEYSHMKRKLDSNLIKKYPKLVESNKDNVPQLWKDEDWAVQFANFIIDLIGENKEPEIIEIHPPFDDYCDNFEMFFNAYNKFENIITKEYPNTKIFIENRCGTFYKKGNFLISNANSIVFFLEELSKRKIKLKLVLDYPQVFSAEKIKLDNINIEKIESFNNKIQKYIKYIGGFHMWGKRKNESDTRWTPHTGDLNTFFSYDEELKHNFLNSIINTFSDGEKRYFVPEVNSAEEDLQSIVADMINAGFLFPVEDKVDSHKFKQIVSYEWKGNKPYINVYDSEEDDITSIALLGIKNITQGDNLRCIGFKDLKEKKQAICSGHNIVSEKNKQCPFCNSKDSFKYCVMCKGIDCRNQSSVALDYCNNEHYVYLAYFPGNKIKVGTAFYKRKMTRLMEQGALMALYIAKVPNGKIAREIEHLIVGMGYVEKVNKSYKIKNLIIDKSKDEILECLKDHYRKIKDNLDVDYTDYYLEDEIFEDYDRRKEIESLFNVTIQTSLFDEVKIVNNFIEINQFIKDKEIIAVIGELAILGGEHMQYIDIKKLLGWEVKDIN